MAMALFPIIAAALYGLGFVLIERAMQSINVATYMFIGGVMGFVIAAALWVFKNEPISFSFMNEKWTTIAIIVGATAAPGLGWLLTTYAIKNVSATYAAFGEVSYPLFAIVFGFLLFGIRYFNWNVLIGGSLIMIGSFILVYGQIRAKTG